MHRGRIWMTTQVCRVKEVLSLSPCPS
jgi:hypothetical protein